MSDPSVLWNSPAIESFLVWSFVRGYENAAGEGVPLILVFPAMALMTEPCFRRILGETILTDFERLAQTVRDSSGKDSVSFGGLTKCIAQDKERTRTAIEFALAAKLVSLDVSTARISALYRGDNKKAESSSKRFRRVEGQLAECLGAAFAGAKPQSIAKLLEVNF